MCCRRKAILEYGGGKMKTEDIVTAMTKKR